MASKKILKRIEIAVHNLEGGIDATQSRVAHLDANTHTAIQQLQTAYQDIEKQHNELHQLHDKLHQNKIDKDKNADRTGQNARCLNRLNEVESIVLTASMPDSIPNRISMFARYDSQDLKMYFVKLEAYFRTRQLHEDAWLSAMQEFMTDDVLYVIEDIPEDDKDTYHNLERTLIDHYRLTPVAKINLSAKLARRFQLPGESAEIFINDVIRQCKRLDCDTDTIIQHLKRGFNVSIQRYLTNQL
jgi:hypothetical protein